MTTDLSGGMLGFAFHPQFSSNGRLFVTFTTTGINGSNYSSEVGYLTSNDGGNTFSPPSRVDTLYDLNEPRGVNGRGDCVARGQGATRVDLTNTCFRADPIMNSIVRCHDSRSTRSSS